MGELPFTKAQIEELSVAYPTPFYIYDEQAMIRNAKRFNSAFAWAKGYRNYFAIKANPNPSILELLAQQGFGADCSSMAELVIAERCGLRGEQIMFTSNDTSVEEFRYARKLNAIINLDDITHIAFLEANAGVPDLVCFRYNPGSFRSVPSSVANIIGDPKEAKYGLTKDQLFKAYRIMKSKGVRRFGLHTMVVSNMLDVNYLAQTASMLFDLAVELKDKLKIDLEFINLGGGIGIPYRPTDKSVDIELLSEKIHNLYTKRLTPEGLSPRIVMECGRAITGPYGYLVSRVLHVTKKYKNFVGLDASMANLMRPALYGAYHDIIVLGKEQRKKNFLYDVTGSLCEDNDKFAVDRHLPKVVPGDVLVIRDVGAHGHSMGFQYNGKLRSAELLLRPDGYKSGSEAKRINGACRL